MKDESYNNVKHEIQILHRKGYRVSYMGGEENYDHENKEHIIGFPIIMIKKTKPPKGF